MRHKVAELERAFLDAAVAKALGHPWRIDDETIVYVKGRMHDLEEESAFCPSMYWDHGGPIIQNERISVIREGWRDEGWIAGTNAEMGPCNRLDHQQFGPTPLVAAMRAYVASVFGDEVEL